MSKFEQAHIFKVLDGNLGDVIDGEVTLIAKFTSVFAQPDLIEPVFQRVLECVMKIQ